MIHVACCVEMPMEFAATAEIPENQAGYAERRTNSSGNATVNVAVELVPL